MGDESGMAAEQNVTALHGLFEDKPNHCTSNNVCKGHHR